MLKARLVGLTGCDGRLGTLLKGSPGDTPISPGPIRPPITPPLQSLLSQIIHSPAGIFGKFQSQEWRKASRGQPDGGRSLTVISDRQKNGEVFDF